MRSLFISINIVPVSITYTGYVFMYRVSMFYYGNYKDISKLVTPSPSTFLNKFDGANQNWVQHLMKYTIFIYFLFIQQSRETIVE